MLRVRALMLTALLAGMVQGLNMAPANAREQFPVDPSELLIVVDPQDVEHTRTVNTDGSWVAAGHLGARPGCPGVQAFVERRLPNGNVAWAKNASAEKDCDEDGEPDGGGGWLFEGMTSLNPDFILSSSIHEMLAAPDGTDYYTGQILVGWNDSDGLTVVWGAFVLQLDRESGDHIADRYIGAQPTTDSPASVASCQALCVALEETTLVQWGGRAIDWLRDPNGVDIHLVLAGWRQTAASDRDVFVMALDRDLTTEKWRQLFLYPGSDMPLDMATGADGSVYFTGYYGVNHDVFVVRLEGQHGTLTHRFMGGGPHDDWGETMTITPAGEIQVEGIFTDTANFEGQILTGSGATYFKVLLTPELQPILIDWPARQTFKSFSGPSECGNSQSETLIAKSGGGVPLPPGGPGEPGGETGTETSNPPTDIAVLVGFAGSGTDPALVQHIDSCYLKLYGEIRPDHEKVEVLFEVPISPTAPRLKSVTLQFKSFFCTDLTVSVGGGAAAPDDFYDLGTVGICPLDEPLINVRIPDEIGEDVLGFKKESQPTEPLQLLVTMGVYGQVCGTCSQLPPGEDEEINTIVVDSDEFP